MTSGRSVGGADQISFDARSLQLECVRVPLHEGLLVHVLMYGSETSVKRGKKRL